MTYYLKKGSIFSPADEANLNIHNKLPAGNYIIKTDQFDNMFFELVDSFIISHKRYGDNPRHTERIINTFLNRENSTGVLLTGEKGSGKSLLAKTVSIRAAELDIPTIIISTPYHGDDFNKFIQDIEQPCIILFDEFEKVYNDNEQQSILTLLDGVFPSKKLFILTCNDKWRIDSHMRNRPGRLYYSIEFTGLNQIFIQEYCKDNLIYKNHIDQICKISTLFNEFNFDMLKALVEEINRYNESPQEAMKILNIKPESDTRTRYDVSLSINDQNIDIKDLSNEFFFGNPLENNFSIEYQNRETEEYEDCYFSQRDLKELNPTNGRFIFVNSRNQQVILTRVRNIQFDYFSVF